MHTTDLDRSAMTFRPYRDGDIPAIIQLYERCFHNHLSQDHWHWKYAQNPYGRHTILVAEQAGKIIAHYGAYPVRVHDGDGAPGIALHIGDVMTDPTVRGAGFGRRSIIARLAQAFYSNYCQGRVQFNFGVPSFKHLRLGKLVLDYHTIGPVQEWRNQGDTSGPIRQAKLPGWLCRKRYRVQRDVPAYAEAEFLHGKNRSRLGISVDRESVYLHWRYGLRPQARYRYYLLVANDQPVLWAVVSDREQEIAIGDVLLDPTDRFAFALFLKALRTDFSGKPLVLWSPARPGWWQECLFQAGFHPGPQPLNVRTAFTFFNKSRYDTLRMNREWFYSMGDFDLF